MLQDISLCFTNTPHSADLTDQAPSPTLTYAVLCLENALDLLPESNEAVSCLPAAPLKDTSSLRYTLLQFAFDVSVSQSLSEFTYSLPNQTLVDFGLCVACIALMKVILDLIIQVSQVGG